MSKNERYLVLEAPDTVAVVDFLSVNLTVRLTVEDGELRIVTQESMGEGSSQWHESDILITLKEGQ